MRSPIPQGDFPCDWQEHFRLRSYFPSLPLTSSSYFLIFILLDVPKWLLERIARPENDNTQVRFIPFHLSLQFLFPFLF